MPMEGVPLTSNADLLSTAEIVRLASLFVRHGVSKIRLTGGEPTVVGQLLEIVGMQISDEQFSNLLLFWHHRVWV